ncbi:uncharacterized protein ACBT44_006687 [Syngnathus typhle]
MPLRTESRRLGPRFLGPFPISKVINPSAVCLRLPGYMKVHPTFHVSRVRPLAAASAPPPRLVEREPAYTVRSLLQSRRHGRMIQYPVDWEGYDDSYRSWVPSRWILNPSLVTEFHHLHSDQPGPRRGRPCRREVASAKGPPLHCALASTPPAPASAASTLADASDASTEY